MTEGNEAKQAGKGGKRPAVRLRLPGSALRKLSAAGVYCQPKVSLAYQKSARRYVLRGVESGGAVREFGHYVAFCDERGHPIPWLQPLQSITANGPHAVIIAPALFSVEMFRVHQTYELMIARHEARSGQDGRPPLVFSQAVFVGRHGYLSLELWGRDQEAAGEIAPEFFTHGGERHDIPGRYLAAVRAVTTGVSLVGCDKAQFSCRPEVVAADGASEETESESATVLKVGVG